VDPAPAQQAQESGRGVAGEVAEGRGLYVGQIAA
jgi:hypothetical protein